MKIIFLNCYSGQLKKPLLDFISDEKLSTDIFCFQEVSESLQKELEQFLSEFKSLFEIGNILTDCGEPSGQSVFVKERLKIISSEKIETYKTKVDDIGFLLKVRLEQKGKEFLLGNVHGTSSPADKKDSKRRSKQSEIILSSFEEKDTPKIIGGDFNLLPETKAIQIFEEKGFRNLISTFRIKTTRNRIAWDRFKDRPNFVKQYYSDYCFVSKGIKILDFQVPDVEVSDHLPLIFEFDI